MCMSQLKLEHNFFLTKNEQKVEHKTILKHRNTHALTKLAAAEGIEL